MIRITCTNCKAQLSIDEAFAGGVCRCQYCGTIQTVPKHMKEGVAGAPDAGKKPKRAAKTLYRDKIRVGSDAGSGLDAIAEIVASSGLSGSGLSSSGNFKRKQPPASPANRGIAGDTPGAPAAPIKHLVPMLIGAAVVIVLLLGVVIGMLMKGGSTGGSDAGTGGGGAGDNSNHIAKNTTPNPAPQIPADIVPDVKPIVPPTPKLTGPSMLGVKLSEPTVIYVLDRGGATKDTFDYMKTACLNSLDTLRADQKFQVIFWELVGGAGPTAYPNAPVNASREEIQKCEAVVDDQASSFRKSEVKGALERALAAKPGAIVLATGKEVDETFVNEVLEARKDDPVHIYCLSMAEKGSSAAMQEIARKTGGAFRLVPLEELKSVTR